MLLPLVALLVEFPPLGNAQSSSSSSSSSLSSPSLCTEDATFMRLTNGCDSVCGSDMCVVVNNADENTNSSSLEATCDSSGNAVVCVDANATDSSGITCTFVCVKHPESWFVTMVGFGEFRSKQEKALRDEYGSNNVDQGIKELGDDSATYPVVSNDVIASVGNLTLGPAVNQLYVGPMSML